MNIKVVNWWKYEGYISSTIVKRTLKSRWQIVTMRNMAKDSPLNFRHIVESLGLDILSYDPMKRECHTHSLLKRIRVVEI